MQPGGQLITTGSGIHSYCHICSFLLGCPGQQYIYLVADLTPTMYACRTRRGIACALLFSPPHCGLRRALPYPPPMRAKAMSTGGQPLSVDDLTAFTARLDGLRPDQHPDDLSSALRDAFKQRELYDVYASSLVEDTDRAKAFLEVLDKVSPVIRPRKLILSTEVWRRPFRLPRTMS